MAFSLLGRVLRRLSTIAASHEANVLKNRAQGRVFVGKKTQIDYRRIFLKENVTLNIGNHSMLCCDCHFDRAGAKVEIGSRSYIASMISCAENIMIGDDVLISSGGSISDHDSHSLDFDGRRQDVVDWLEGRKDWTHVRMSPVRIESRVWIGFNVIVLRGVTIGEGAVVGAGSVVPKDIPPYTLAVGNPARVIRKLSRPKDSLFTNEL